ncbi:MAG: cytochrome C oxidase subunit II [Candidatus Eisenbacteria bacterium]|nr:cytochrome C oxidase subunit II [Candidatus Eisenbacteria bacterium]
MIEHYIPSLSTYSSDVDQLVWLVTILVGFWFVAAEVMFFWLIWRFRARAGVAAQYVTGKEKRLKRWINVPHTLILVCDVLIIVAAIRVWYKVKQTLPPADETVRVISQQWTWTFQQPGPDGRLDTPDDIFSADTLHVPVNRTVHFQLESKDVLHSFFVPVFRLKQDAVPGRVITGWFRATRTGVHDIRCSQICGVAHGIMSAEIEIQSQEQHAAWMRSHAGTPIGAFHAGAGGAAPAPAGTTTADAPRAALAAAAAAADTRN